MIRENEIAALRHSEYNSDEAVMEMLDTIQALWRVARAAEKIDLMPNLWDAAYETLVWRPLHDILAALRETEKA